MSHPYDLVCLSHLRWDFVYQRPQHLLSRSAKERRTFFFEEPVFDNDLAHPHLEVRKPLPNIDLTVATPHIPIGFPYPVDAQHLLLQQMLSNFQIHYFVLWYYTPMALPFTRDLEPLAIVYDCMDQLSAFHNAPPDLIENEKELFRRANVVFTGGHSLYDAKKNEHDNVHAFPSSVDVAHFAQARSLTVDPADQAAIAHPRAGFFGVIDERLDINLLHDIANLRPDVQFVMIGPVVKIDPATLPQNSNIHYLGGKSYQDLPHYLAGWDVAIMPFAINEATRFISPTKTPEYLAAGKPVVSTPITDVVRPYFELGLVHIGATADEFVTGIDSALAENPTDRRRRADEFLSKTSWDRTWAGMRELIDQAVANHWAGSAITYPAGASLTKDVEPHQAALLSA